MNDNGVLTVEGRELFLRMAFNNSSERPERLFLGLAASPLGAEATLEDIEELSDHNYSRQEIYFSQPVNEGPVSWVTNVEEITFGPWEEDSPQSISRAFITDVSAGYEGLVFGVFNVDEPFNPSVGEEVIVYSGGLDFGLR